MLIRIKNLSDTQLLHEFDKFIKIKKKRKVWQVFFLFKPV